jgi:ABC-type glycerol-3-phosphate transport system substrate-binding protein
MNAPDDKQFKSWLSRKADSAGAFSKNKTALKRFHDDVISSDRIGTDASGKSNTMLLGTTQLFGDGKEYIVPFYNPETGKEIPFNSPEEKPWLDKWRKEAKKGNLVPYNTVDEAENAMEQIRSRILADTPKQ